MTRTVTMLIACLALASCAPGGGRGGGGPAAYNPELHEACRQAADRVYDARHRGDIFAPTSGVNTPQSGNYTSSANGQHLADIFERDNDIQDCERRAGLVAAPAEPPPAPPPAR